MYEVSKLIIQVIGHSKETKREVVLKLGYKNLDKGYRRLYHLIETGECPEPIKKMLPTALGVHPQVVEDAFETTARQKQEEVENAKRCQEEYERRTFKPHLWIEHERKRPPGGTICIVAFIGIENFKVLNLPENINELGWGEQVRLVQEHKDAIRKKRVLRMIYLEKWKVIYTVGPMMTTFYFPEMGSY